MQLNSSPKRKITETVMVVLLAPLLATYFIFQARYSNIAIFDLRFNAYALLSLAATLICIVFLALAFFYKIKGQVALWSVGYISGLAIFTGGEMFQRLSATPQGAVFWSHIESMGFVFLPAMAFLFALTYMRPNSDNTFIAPFILLGSAINAFFGVSGSLVYKTSSSAIKLYPWGYNNSTGPAFILYALWFIIVSVTTIVLFFNFWRHTANRLLRRQATLYMVGFTLPFVFGLITDGILPATGVEGVLPPLLGLFSIFIGGSLILGLTKYKLFQFTPSILAQDILLTMRESVVVTNNNLEIEYLNSDAEILLGGKLEDISRKRFDTFLDKPEFDFKERLDSFDANKKSLIIDNLTITKPDLRKYYLRLAAGKIFEDNVVEGFVFAITDITELHNSYELIQKEKESVEQKVVERTRQLQEEHVRLQASLNSLLAGFFITDKNKSILNINTSAKKILSNLVNFESIREPKNIQSEWTLDDVEDKLRNKFDLRNNINWCLENRKPKQPEEIGFEDQFVRIYLAPIVDNVASESENSVLGVVVLLEDITEEKIAERSKNEFFTIASHELRTPLAIIDGNLGMIKFSYKGKIETKMQTMLESINKSNARLTKIVNELLEVSGLEQSQPKLKFSVFSIDLIVGEVYKAQIIDAEKKKIHLEVQKNISSLPKVSGNPDSVMKVLTNLVSNAIAATEKGGVKINFAIENGDSLKVSVSDTGSGISIENQRLLFRKFQQASDSLLVRSDGVGLGLYSSRLIMKNMGGEIKLDQSIIGVGSTFSFNLTVASNNRGA